jgi:hypothetical protein
MLWPSQSLQEIGHANDVPADLFAALAPPVLLPHCPAVLGLASASVVRNGWVSPAVAREFIRMTGAATRGFSRRQPVARISPAVDTPAATDYFARGCP